IRTYTQAVTLRAAIEKQFSKHGEESCLYDQLSAVLKRGEELCMSKIRDPPVRGLVVEADGPLLDGVSWHRANTMRQVEAAIDVCCQQAGECKTIVWDNSEHADPDMKRMIDEGLVASGWQLIRAEVSPEKKLRI